VFVCLFLSHEAQSSIFYSLAFGISADILLSDFGSGSYMLVLLTESLMTEQVFESWTD
jgi:hypothetical protein